MAFETIVNGKILNSKNNPVVSATINLNAVLEQNTITGYRNTKAVSSSTTDTNGNVQFSGVTAGLYDVVVISGGTFTLFNYQVKNEYVVLPGDTSEVEENRRYIRSSEHFSGNSFSTTRRQNVQLGYPLDPTPSPTFTVLQTNNVNFVDRLQDTPFTRTSLLERDTSDTAVRDNQNVKQVQSFIFKIPT